MLSTIVYTAGALTSILMILIGSKRGLLSPLLLLGSSILFGFYLRYAVIINTNPDVNSFSFVLSNATTTDYTILGIEILIAQLFIFIGYFTYSPSRKKWGAEKLFYISPARISAVVALGLFSLVWGFYFFQLLRAYGSIAAAYEVLQRKGASESSEILIAGSLLFVAAAALAMLAVWARHHSGPNRIRSAIVLMLALAHISLVFLTRSRQETIIHAVSILVPLFATKVPYSRINFKSAMIGILGAAGAVSVLAVGAAMRTSARGATTFEQAFAEFILDLPVQISDTFNFLDLYGAARFFSDVTGIKYGVNYLDFVFRFIPRDIWPEKPIILGTQIREFLYGDRISGVPPTVFGEFYIAFGAPGLAGGCLFFGALARWLTKLQDSSAEYPILKVIFVYTVLTLEIGTVKTGFEIGLFGLMYFYTGLIIVKFGSIFAFSSRSAGNLGSADSRRP